MALDGRRREGENRGIPVAIDRSRDRGQESGVSLTHVALGGGREFVAPPGKRRL